MRPQSRLLPRPLSLVTDNPSQYGSQQKAQHHFQFDRHMILPGFFLAGQQTIEGVHVRFGTGDDYICVRSTASIGHAIAFNAAQYFADGVNTLGNRLYASMAVVELP